MPHWITDPAPLHALIAAAPPSIGMDTEFVRERTYWPQLALVQIAGGDALPDEPWLQPRTIAPRTLDGHPVEKRA